MTLAREIQLVSRPVGAVRREDLELKVVDMPDPADGEVQIAAVPISVDPIFASAGRLLGLFAGRNLGKNLVRTGA